MQISRLKRTFRAEFMQIHGGMLISVNDTLLSILQLNNFRWAGEAKHNHAKYDHNARPKRKAEMFGTRCRRLAPADSLALGNCWELICYSMAFVIHVNIYRVGGINCYQTSGVSS